ncbi:hypothetical protein BDZ94DRAFT_1316777 [Collybia nuda]|uniref:Uncharacterized protein n=1 Tax=Collybia nuda TaxID=64659 RepID=A0A9P6CK71_9AGAR|nr:hypothetical protein BDZ94DRAFT_1316777 [Collybia nuda]
MYGFKLTSFPDRHKKSKSLQTTIMITSFPTEVLQKIIRLATDIPSAFDTSVEGSVPDKETEVSLAIDQSMRCRLSLCRVSKSFYALALEKLYEIVTIRTHKDVFLLARLLRVQTKLGGNLRGWYCRRLELRFAQGRQTYQGHYWDSGAKNHWGLADACPNLIIFIANITRNQIYYDGPSHFTIPRMLFQTIAHTCAKTLRRFEMRGDTRVGFDRVEMFLRYCPVIEVCRLNAVDPAGPNFSYDAADKVWEDDWSDEEPIEEFHHERRGDPLALVTEHLADVLPHEQITRLTYSGTSPILWGIINALPNLTDLGFSSGDLDFSARRPELVHHTNLAHIRFYPASLDALHGFLDRMTDAVKGGLLPALKTLYVYGFISDSHRRMSAWRISNLNKLGVKAEILEGHGNWLLRVKYTTRTREDLYAEL